jgi:hypothetical protein
MSDAVQEELATKGTPQLDEMMQVMKEMLTVRMALMQAVVQQRTNEDLLCRDITWTE